MRLKFAFMILTGTLGAAWSQPTESWWPDLKPPRTLRLVSTDNTSPEKFLAQSVVGLSVQGVNAGLTDAMYWNVAEYETDIGYFRWCLQQLGQPELPPLPVWHAVDSLVSRGVVKGYVLFRPDPSQGEAYTTRSGMDKSANVATLAAGQLQGVMVAETLEAKAKALGLKLLYDARGKSELSAFNAFKAGINRSLLLGQDPKVHQARDIAIAVGAMTVFGSTDATPSALANLLPMSAFIGWNFTGDEGQFVQQASRLGHFVVASNWNLNLAPMVAMAASAPPSRRFAEMDPNTIAYSDGRPAVSFVLSDGDNFTWFTGNFEKNLQYWGSPDAGRFAMNYGGPLGELIHVAPSLLASLQAGQKSNASMVFMGGGYYYPDLLGLDRTDLSQAQLLAIHARRMSAIMEAAGSRVLMFLCMKVDSPEAQAAYAALSREIKGLTGILVIQYAPYEGGGGKVWWNPDARGRMIPTVSARFSLWENWNLPTGGTPAKVARLLNDASRAPASQPLHAWTVVHAWSKFKKVPGTDESAENPSPGDTGLKSGVTATGWAVDRLDSRIKVVRAEEMLWRMRMQKDPTGTRDALAEWAPASIPQGQGPVRGNPAGYLLRKRPGSPFSYFSLLGRRLDP